MLETDGVRERFVGVLNVVEYVVDVERFNVDTGDIRAGDVDNGEPDRGGDALLLRDIGGLNDHNFELFSLEQEGIFVPFRSLSVTSWKMEPICGNLYTHSYLSILRLTVEIISAKRKR